VVGGERNVFVLWGRLFQMEGLPTHVVLCFLMYVYGSTCFSTLFWSRDYNTVVTLGRQVRREGKKEGRIYPRLVPVTSCKCLVTATAAQHHHHHHHHHQKKDGANLEEKGRQ
jgi:hypothetical protein